MSGITISIVGAAVGAAIAIGTASASGAASAKAKKAAGEAEKVAKKKVEEARREIQRMPMQELALDLQGFKAEQEASQVAAAQSMQAAQEGETRGLAAAAGRTQMADIAQQRAARIDKATDLQKLEMLKAKERQEASDKLYDLNLAEAEGAQVAAAESERMSEAYKQQAIQGGMQAIQGVANVAGAALAPKMQASEAYDRSIAGAGEANIKDFLLKDPEAMRTYGDRINTATGEELKQIFIDAVPYKSWSDEKLQYRLFRDMYEARYPSSPPNGVCAGGACGGSLDGATGSSFSQGGYTLNVD
jgi:hypothetical protein